MKLLFITSLIITSYQIIAQTKTPCSKYPNVIEDYSPAKPNYHIYTVKDFVVVDLKEYPQASKSLVYQVMLSNAITVAPGTVNEPITDCGELDVPPFGKILTKITPTEFSVTNYTLPEHYLANGKVTRHIMQMGSKIFVRTTGVGNNQNPFWKVINGNQAAADYIWGNPNAQLKVKTLQLLKDPENNASNNSANNPTPDDNASLLQGSDKAVKEAVKQGAITFYKWFESPAHYSYSRTEDAFAEKMVITTRKKVGSRFKDYCPCRIDTKVVESFLSYAKTAVPISDKLISTWRKDLLEAQNYFNLQKSEIDKTETLWFAETCYFIDGQDFPDGFEKMGFYNGKAIWDVSLNPDGTATVKTTFRTQPDWGSTIYAFQIDMAKDKGVWKLASIVHQGEDVKPSPVFK